MQGFLRGQDRQQIETALANRRRIEASLFKFFPHFVIQVKGGISIEGSLVSVETRLLVDGHLTLLVAIAIARFATPLPIGRVVFPVLQEAFFFVPQSTLSGMIRGQYLSVNLVQRGQIGAPFVAQLLSDRQDARHEGRRLDIDFEFDKAILQMGIVLGPSAVSASSTLGRDNHDLARSLQHVQQDGVPIAVSGQIKGARAVIAFQIAKAILALSDNVVSIFSCTLQSQDR